MQPFILQTDILQNLTIFANKYNIFLQKNVDMSKLKGTLVLKIIFSETTYVSVPTY